MAKSELTTAAESHAKAVLGDEQFKNNRDARQSIMNDFGAGADWANKNGDKAKKWDALNEEIERRCFIVNEGTGELEDNPDADLLTIGEITAKLLGIC